MEKNRVVCVVGDTGRGISKLQIERIFDPFFTTKSPDRGTGLGLSVSKQIVETYGGRFEVYSIEGMGTVFSFDLPNAAAHPK